MKKTASKQVVKTPRKPRVARPPAPPSADERLSEHLKQAEHHLIEAVTLFSGPQRVERRVGYLRRLENAQEAITGLYREELVRIRGPISKRGKK